MYPQILPDVVSYDVRKMFGAQWRLKLGKYYVYILTLFHTY